MTKREIMVRAHEIARTMEGHYTARMSAGLRQAWMEARLIAVGGKLWEKHGHRRVYFNNLVELYGLELEYYNTGNIYRASLDGECISNRSAREYVWDLRNGKLWYDLNTGEFASRDMDQDMADRLIGRLQGAV